MLNRLIEIATQAGNKLLRMQGEKLQVRQKGRGQLVTRADEASHAIIEAELQRSFPGVPRVMEEQDNHRLPARPYFTVDELDGTLPYARGMAEWAVMLAYLDKRPTHGVIYLPAWNVLIAAQAGKGCSLDQAVVGMELNLFLTAEHRRRFVNRLSQRALSTRSLACAGAAVAELLMRRTDLYVNCRGGKIWDFAPGALAVEEAGGTASRIDGAPIAWRNLRMDVLLAADAHLRKQALKVSSA